MAGTLLGFGLAVTVIAQAGAEPLACDDEEIVETVLDVFNAVQDTDLKSGMEMTALDPVVSPGLVTGQADDDWTFGRACTATGSMNKDGPIDVFYWIVYKEGADPYDYRLKLCFSKFDPVHLDCKAMASAN